jgi:anti-anti-sigma regulatory factor
MSMLKIESKPEATGAVRLALAGRMHANSLGDLRRAIDRARRKRGRVELDLSEITLVDRASLDFLMQQSKDEIELINCPAYLAPWIARERSG